MEKKNLYFFRLKTNDKIIKRLQRVKVNAFEVA